MRTRKQLKAGGQSGEAADWQASALWRSLETMRIEPEGAALTFVARLARENGWGTAHADAVYEEYRRFLYLAAVAGPVTPAEDVDQAWHLHLTYSRHYWDELCEAILRRPLHHEPTAGGRREAMRHAQQYEATLRRYREMFGAPPPADIWPGAAERFAGRSRRVDATRYWLVPKGIVRRGTALALGSLPIAACTSLAANRSSGGGSIALGLVGLLLVMALLAGMIFYGIRRDRRRDGGGGGCGGGSGGSNDCDGSSGCGGGCGGD